MARLFFLHWQACVSPASSRSGLCSRGKNGLVDHFGRGYGFFQSGQRFSPRVIVVEEGMDDTVAREKRNSLLQIRYRVEYGGINRWRQVTFQREIR